MTNTFRFSLVIIGALLFAVGLLLGQQIERSKFEKYLRPSTVTPLDLGLLRVNIEVIRDHMGFGVPSINYDASCTCFAASAVVTSDLMKKPLDQVRATLMTTALNARNALAREFPEFSKAPDFFKPGAIPDHDFKMTFWELNLDKPGDNGTVAEYIDGKIVFK